MLKDPVFLTVILEVLALLLLKEKEPLFYVYWTAVTVFTNVLANAYVSFVFDGTQLEYYLTVAAIEALVFIAEMLACFAYTKDIKKSAKYSAICNLASFGIGYIIYIFIT